MLFFKDRFLRSYTWLFLPKTITSLQEFKQTLTASLLLFAGFSRSNYLSCSFCICSITNLIYFPEGFSKEGSLDSTSWSVLWVFGFTWMSQLFDRGYFGEKESLSNYCSQCLLKPVKLYQKKDKSHYICSIIVLLRVRIMWNRNWSECWEIILSTQNFY